MKETKSTKEKAYEFVEEYECGKGRKPRHLPIGSGHDVESDGRKIEVKGCGGDWGNIVLTPQSYEKMKETEGYFLYVATHLDSEDKSEWRLYILDKQEVLDYGVEWTEPRLAVTPKKRERGQFRAL